MPDLVTPDTIVELKHAPGSPCPRCRRPRDPKAICWFCHDRNCLACGKLTGGAFFPHCIACQPRDPVLVPDGPGEPPANPKRWLMIVECSEGTSPTSGRVKLMMKRGLYLGCKVIAWPVEPPPETRFDKPLEVE